MLNYPQGKSSKLHNIMTQIMANVKDEVSVNSEGGLERLKEEVLEG